MLCKDLQAENVTGVLLSGSVLLNPQYILLSCYSKPCCHKLCVVFKLLFCENEILFQTCLSFQN